MVDEFDDGPQEVAWNAASHIINQIGGLLSAASAAYLIDDFRKSFLALKEVKKKIIASLKDEEKRNLRMKEKVIVDNLAYLNNETHVYNHPNFVAGKKRLVSELIDEYNDLIMNHLYQYGYGIGMKEDTTRMVV